MIQDKISTISTSLKNAICNDERAQILMPKPIKGLVKLVLQGDRKVRWLGAFESP